MINLILMVDEKWGISKDGNQIYNLPKHDKKIKELITNNIVVYGFNYHMKQELKPIPNCINYVLGPEYIKDTDSIKTFHSLKEMLTHLKTVDKDVYVLGGLTTLKSFFPYASKIYVTQINKDFKADKSFYNISKHVELFTLSESSEEFKYRNTAYHFLVYESIKRNQY